MEKDDIILTRDQFDCLNDEDCWGIFVVERDAAHALYTERESQNTTDVVEYFHHEIYNVEFADALFDKYETLVVRKDDSLWGYNGTVGTLIKKAVDEGFYEAAQKAVK